MGKAVGANAQELLVEVARRDARIEQLQDQIDRIVTITSGIIYVVDANGYFTFVNRAVEEILHYRPEELVGRHFSFIMEDDEYRRVGRKWVLPQVAGRATGDVAAPKIFDERRTGARRTRDMEVHLLTKEKREERILVGDVAGIIGVEGAYDARRLQPGDDMAKGFLGSQGIIFDITRYRKAEVEQRELLRRVLESQKIEAVERLAGGIAHEFNTKIGAILGYSDLIREKYASTDPDIARLADPIVQAARRISDLTEKLLAFARKEDYRLVPVDLNAVVRDVVDLLENVVDTRVDIRCSLCRSGAPVMGDAAQLRNSLLNLAFNALDAMESGGWLGFSTEIVELDDSFVRGYQRSGKGGSYVRLTVTDTGRGIDEEIRSKIFEPFFSTKQVGNELGMGLAGVYGCAKHHEGFVATRSREGVGTSFDLYIPCKPAVSPSEPG